MNYSADIKKLPRKFIPGSFKVTNWETLESFFKNLLDKTIDSKETLEQWLKDISELEAVLSEDGCWRQIKVTCDTENKDLEEAFTYFMMEIQPKAQPYADKLNVTADTAAAFSLDGAYSKKWKKELFFGAAQIKKNYVSFYLMPVYMYPDLLANISPELRKHMQGKSCFNFKKIEASLFDEITQLTKQGFERFIKEEYL
jgi:hypothetical protein